MFIDRVRDESFARRLAIMIQSQLISYRHYTKWADAVIAAMENPPFWILELATTRYAPKAALAILEGNAFSSAAQSGVELEKEHVACLFLRYRRRELSWATFLNVAGNYTDGPGKPFNCQYAYRLLNEFEASEFSMSLEETQREDMEARLATGLRSIEPIYSPFADYGRC